MTRQDRVLWLRRHGVGISLIVLAYLLITVLRSLRADFAPGLWAALGTSGEPSVYSRSEMWVALGVMLSSGLLVTIKDNGRAFLTAVGIAIFGFGLVMYSLIALDGGSLSGFPFMVLVGLGLYLPYVVVHTTIFERLIALTRDRGNLGYLISRRCLRLPRLRRSPPFSGSLRHPGRSPRPVPAPLLVGRHPWRRRFLHRRRVCVAKTTVPGDGRSLRPKRSMAQFHTKGQNLWALLLAPRRRTGVSSRQPTCLAESVLGKLPDRQTEIKRIYVLAIQENRDLLASQGVLSLHIDTAPSGPWPSRHTARDFTPLT